MFETVSVQVIIFLFKPGTWSSKWHGLGLEVVWPWPRSGVALASKWHGLGLKVVWPWPRSGVALASKWSGLVVAWPWPWKPLALYSRHHLHFVLLLMDGQRSKLYLHHTLQHLMADSVNLFNGIIGLL